MNSLINRNKKTTTFEELFIQLAMNQVSKLPFTTKEEYLAWVDQWKSDFKLVMTQYKFDTWEYKKNGCIRPEKIAYYQKKLDSLPKFTVEDINRYGTLVKQFLAAYNPPCYSSFSLYLVWHMLIVRKAGKLKSHAQYVLRKQKELVPA
jgi:hypothetical protein